MKKLSLKNFYGNICLGAALAAGGTFLNPNTVLAQTFEPIWEEIEINQGPHSENLEASQVFTSALKFYFSGNLKYAAIAFQKALSFDPNMAISYYLLGNTLFQQGRVEDAMIQYNKAIKANPFVAEVYNNLGTALSAQGNHEQAIAQYEKALEIDPNFAIATYNMGLAFVQLGQPDQGLSFLKTAREMFIRAGEDEHAHTTEKFIQCGLLPSKATRDAKLPPICQS
jgi:tetratricopeptide (TPR) repeat protein